MSTTGTRGVLRAAGSLWFAAVLLVLMLFAMACATVFETARGAEQARTIFYRSWWFQGLLGLFGLNVLASVLLRLPLKGKHAGFAITHLSLLLILVGAWVTHVYGIDGQVGLMEGQSTTQFRDLEREALILIDSRDGAETALELDNRIFGKFEAARLEQPPTLVKGKLRIAVLEYLPDGELVLEAVEGDSPGARPAVSVTLTTPEGEDRGWLFMDRPDKIGPAHMALRSVRDQQELERLLTPGGDDEVTDDVVKVTVAGQEYELPLAQALRAEQPLGDSGYALRVLQYLPDAKVGPDGKITSASRQPINPAIELEIRGKDKTERRVAFAKFPGFGHGGNEFKDVEVVFVKGNETQPLAPIEFVLAPDGKLYVRFQTHDGISTSGPITLNKTVEAPWRGVHLVVGQLLPRAVGQWVAREVSPARQQRHAMVRVRVDIGEQSNEAWIEKYSAQTVTAQGVRYTLIYSDKSLPLGAELRLDRFHMSYYPGTQRPRTFESFLTVTDPETGESRELHISMNKPGQIGEFKLFQSSYKRQGDRWISYLSVSRDPGQNWVFAGYFTLMGGMIVVLITRASEQRKRRALLAAAEAAGPAETPKPRPRPTTSLPVARLLVGAVGLGLLALPLRAEPKLPAHVDLDAVRDLPLQADGRWPPLDTVARETVEKVTGELFFRDHDPVLVVLAWICAPEEWRDEPLITIGNAELRKALELPAGKEVFSFGELASHAPLMRVWQEAMAVGDAKRLDALQEKALTIREKLLTLQDTFVGRRLLMIPDPQDRNARWKPVDQQAPEQVRQAWEALKAAYLADDGPAFAKAAGELKSALRALPAAYYPAPEQIALELRFNRLHPFTTAWEIMVGGAILAALALVVRRRWFDLLSALTLAAGFGVLTYGLYLRWHIAGRIPAANMFESLLFLSWGTGLFAILSMLVTRHRLIPLTASGLGALALLLADVLPLDSYVRPIAPVLMDTYWMSIHVPIIMVSYAVLALAVVVAHVQMVAMAAAPGNKQLSEAIDRMHYWYVQFGSLTLAAGIITGSMWAASSWGRYWGWDPKEVWSLVALLGYLAILHVRIDRERVPGWMYGLAAVLAVAVGWMVIPKLAPLTPMKIATFAATGAAMLLFVLTRSMMATALKSILAFWLIIMTYVGVNYVLGIGLHSYAFGKGAVVHYLYRVGGADLALIALCGLIYLLWRPRRPAGAPATA